MIHKTKYYSTPALIHIYLHPQSLMPPFTNQKTNEYHPTPPTTLTTHNCTFFLATLALFTTRIKALRPVISLVTAAGLVMRKLRRVPTANPNEVLSTFNKKIHLWKSHMETEHHRIMFQTLTFFVLFWRALICYILLSFPVVLQKQKLTKPNLCWYHLIEAKKLEQHSSANLPCRSQWQGLINKENHTSKSINRKKLHSYHGAYVSSHQRKTRSNKFQKQKQIK